MTMRLEAYTIEGVRSGIVLTEGNLTELLETVDELWVTDGQLTPLDGSPPIADRNGRSTLPVDELIVVVAPPDTTLPIHAVWHDVLLAAGPYVLAGQMPTLPGFDSARALARPTGTFVLLARATLSLAGRPEAGAIEIPLALVHRYVVEHVRSDLELGFYFPGAGSASGRSVDARLAASAAPPLTMSRRY